MLDLCVLEMFRESDLSDLLCRRSCSCLRLKLAVAASLLRPICVRRIVLDHIVFRGCVLSLRGLFHDKNLQSPDALFLLCCVMKRRRDSDCSHCSFSHSSSASFSAL